MALIGKIRKNFWFVLLLLGLALAAFIMMDMTGSSGPGGAVTSMTMGNVDGQKINYQDFSRLIIEMQVQTFSKKERQFGIFMLKTHW